MVVRRKNSLTVLPGRLPFWALTVLLALVLGVLAPASAQARPVAGEKESDPIFVTSQTDKQEVWQGEPLSWQFKLWRCVNLRVSPEYNPPSAPGFMALSQSEDSAYQNVGKLEYLVNRLSTWLIPLEPGTYSVSSASIRVVRQAFSPTALMVYGDFFDHFFTNTTAPQQSQNTWSFSLGAGSSFTMTRSFSSSGGGSALLSSKECQVKVKPLPTEGRPVCFTGAVGNYSVRSSLSSPQAHVGEPVTITQIIQGSGNIGHFDPPQNLTSHDFCPSTQGSPEAQGSFRLLDVRSDGGFAPVDPRQAMEPTRAFLPLEPPGGLRTFRIIVVPQKVGTFQMKAPDFAYFDPADAQYHVIEGSLFSLQVLPGEDVGMAEFEGLMPLDKGDYVGWTALPHWLLWCSLLPLAALVAFWLWHPLRPRLLKGLEAAQAAIEAGQPAYGVFHNWCRELMGEKYAGYTRREIVKSLDQYGLCPEHLQEFVSLWNDMDGVRFGVGGGDEAAFNERLLQLIAALQQEVQPGTLPALGEKPVQSEQLSALERCWRSLKRTCRNWWRNLRLERPKWLQGTVTLVVLSFLILLLSLPLRTVMLSTQSGNLSAKALHLFNVAVSAEKAEEGQSDPLLESRALYGQVLSEGAATAEAHYNLACAEYRLHNLASARQHLEQACALRPRSAELRLALDKVLAELNTSWHAQAEQAQRSASSGSSSEPAVVPTAASQPLTWLGLSCSTAEMSLLWGLFALIALMLGLCCRNKAALAVILVGLVCLACPLSRAWQAPEQVLKSGQPVYSGPGSNYQCLGNTWPGEKAQILGEQVQGEHRWLRMSLRERSDSPIVYIEE